MKQYFKTTVIILISFLFSKIQKEIKKCTMVAHCCQLKFESSLKLHLRYNIILKFQTEIKIKIDF